MRILLMIFLFSLNSFGQLKINYSSPSDGELFSQIRIPEGKFVEENYEKTGVLKEHYFYSESYNEDSILLYRVDSLKRYYENGNLAYSGILLDNKSGHEQFGEDHSLTVNVSFLSTSAVTYYKDGSRRSVLYKDETNEKLNYFFCYFDKETNIIIYRKEVYNGENISGSFICYSDDNDHWIVTFYQSGTIREKWIIASDFLDNDDFFIIKKVELSNSTVISNQNKLKKYFRGKNILFIRNDLIIY